MIPEHIKKQLILKFSAPGGDERLYKFLLTFSLEKIIDQNLTANPQGPEIELMELYDKFLILYRKEGDEALFEIAKICRKAAHKIYRLLIKKNLIEKNSKFLNLVE